MTARTLDCIAFSRLGPRANGVESELLTINAAAPDVLDLPALFSSAVTDAISNILDDSTAKALEVYIGKANMGDPSAVLASLEALLDQGAPILKGAIAEEFRSKVHSLYEEVVLQAKDALAIDSPVLTQGATDKVQVEEAVSQSPSAGLQEEQDVVIRFVKSAKSQRS